MADSNDVHGDVCAFVAWPDAPFTRSLVLTSLEKLSIPSSSTLPQNCRKLIQWSTYDAIDHELTHAHPENVLSSSYSIRKALIRKHFLSHTIRSHTAKRPHSILRHATPKTWELEISYVDELDEMWTDELYDLGLELDASGESNKWWILKPGMADRGMGIRLFGSKATLQEIFEEFEDADESADDEDENPTAENPTAVATSQLRHFVIQLRQEYLMNPLLFDPSTTQRGSSASRQLPSQDLQGFKFHLRAYCVASADLTLYLYTNILALFSSVPYIKPQPGQVADLAPHLTNTSLQMERGEEGVHLLSELIGCPILSGETRSTLTTENVGQIMDQIADILAEVFEAALGSSVHFQPLPNAFELFGVDFIIEHVEASIPGGGPIFQVLLLEVNAEPAIELTGPRLSWALSDLFNAVGRVCIQPAVRPELQQERETWRVGETRDGLRKCLDVQVRGKGSGI